MSKISNYVGLAVGALIIIFSIVVFNVDPIMNVDDPARISTVKRAKEEPQYESKSYYGGDAYTGMQQASAQAANNMIPVYFSIQQSNENTAALNKTIGAQMSSNAKNLEKAVNAITICFGFLLLSIGLLTVLKYVSAILNKKSVAAPLTPCSIPVSQPEEAVLVADEEVSSTEV